MRRGAFSRYDTADYLKSKKDMAAYLEACMAEAGDDPPFIAVALGNLVRAHDLRQVAKSTGITRSELSQALSHNGNPSLAMVLRLLKALGLKLTPQLARERKCTPAPEP